MAQNEIVSKEGLHTPDVYDLLTFHNAMFERSLDSLDDKYYPLTASPLRSTDILPFVIGLIPPSDLVTGRLLDRSGSLGVSDAMTNEAALEDPNPEPVVPEGARQSFDPKATPMPATDAAELIKNAWATNFGIEIPENALRILMAQWATETNYGTAMSNYNFTGRKGYAPDGAFYRTSVPQGKKKPPIVTDRRSYSSGTAGANDFLMGLKHVPGALPAAQAGNLNAFVKALKDAGYISDTPKGYAERLSPHLKKTAAQLDKSAPKPKAQKDARKKVKSDTPNGTAWAQQGSNAAATSAGQQSVAAHRTQGLTDPNTSSLGQSYSKAQRQIQGAIKDAIARMKATPPLQMLINPTSFSIAHSKLITDTGWGRNGPNPLIEQWGDNQDVITAQGRIAGFYSEAVNNNYLAGGPGLNRATRAFSVSYQNLMSLYLLYRNNGTIWLEDFADPPGHTTKPNNLALVGSVYLSYDGVMYIGSFNSFEITEEAESPFTLSYTFEFTVRQTFSADMSKIQQGLAAKKKAAEDAAAKRSAKEASVATTTPSPPAGGGTVALPPGTTVSDGLPSRSRNVNIGGFRGDL